MIGGYTCATPDTVVHEGDILVVAGETRRAEQFGELLSAIRLKLGTGIYHRFS